MDIIDIYQENTYKNKKKKEKEEEKEEKEEEEEEEEKVKEKEEEEEVVMDDVLLKILYNKNMNQIEPNIIEYECHKEKKQNKNKNKIIKKNIIAQESNITMYQRKFNPRFPPYKLRNIII